MLKLGRRPRIFRPEVPHYSALLAGRQLPPPPVQCDWTKGMNPDFGMMLNDRLGDCTAAAIGHAVQIWSFNTGAEFTPTDADVENLYSASTGYTPGDPTTDQGGVEQEVLGWLLKTNAIAAFVEVDPRNMDDVRRVIADCGVAYIGIDLPQHIMGDSGTPDIWQVLPQVLGKDPIIGGHAVILTGYDMDGLDLISWGKKYRMSYGFLATYCDEAYAIADPEWIRVKNRTPAGLTLEQLESQMEAMRDAAF